MTFYLRYDTEVNGVEIKRGSRVYLHYGVNNKLVGTTDPDLGDELFSCTISTTSGDVMTKLLRDDVRKGIVGSHYTHGNYERESGLVVKCVAFNHELDMDGVTSGNIQYTFVEDEEGVEHFDTWIVYEGGKIAFGKHHDTVVYRQMCAVIDSYIDGTSHHVVGAQAFSSRSEYGFQGVYNPLDSKLMRWLVYKGGDFVLATAYVRCTPCAVEPVYPAFDVELTKIMESWNDINRLKDFVS